MAIETILQYPIFANFALPFLLIFFIIFAVLEKTKLLGDEKTQLNALTAFVIGLIFVGAVFPKQVVSNMILFLTVSIVVVFVTLLIWGFITGGDLKGAIVSNNGLKWVIGIVLVLVVIVAVLWASGIEGGIFDMLFKQNWSETFWTNFIFIVVIAAALALIWKGSK